MEQHIEKHSFIPLTLIYFIPMLFVYIFFQNSTILENIFDMLQFAISLAAGVYCLRKGLLKGQLNYIVQIGYACIIWSLGQLFWLVYVLVGREGLPYPSVAELAFIGAYFFFIASMKLAGETKYEVKLLFSLLCIVSFAAAAVIIVVLAGAFFSFKGIYIIMYMVLTAWVLRYALVIPKLPGWLKGAVIILCFTDFMMIAEILFKMQKPVFLSDTLFPFIFIILFFGAGRERNG